MAEQNIFSCKQKNCKVLTTGKCLEGFEINKCPHVIREDFKSTAPHEKLTQNAGTSQKSLNSQDAIDLYSGDCLNLASSIKITSAYLTRVIVLAGLAESGKTTLLAALYEAFQKAPFANYIFAGSDTLVGFEKRVYLSRINSLRQIPDTERTRISDDTPLLHLCVRDVKLSKPAQHLLFTDISGERFKSMKDSIDECKKFTILQRANYFVLLVDTNRLANKEQRQETRSSSITMLRSCIDSGMLGKQSLVDIFFSKWDVVIDDPHKTELEIFIGHMRDQIKEQFETKLGKLRFAYIAARPTRSSNLEFCYGLKEIFPSWIEDSAPLPIRDQHYSDMIFNEEFDKYLWKKQI